MPPLSVMIKPASGRCNLQCAYCFYEDESRCRTTADYGLMSKEVAEHIVQKTVQTADECCSFVFQGGEPTLAGLDFFREFVALVKKHAPSDLKINYALQTNGVLIDGAWAEFFAQNHVLVGLSLDGDKECHDCFRRDKKGQGSFARAFNTVQILRDYRVEFNILTVVTKLLAEKIDRVFSFYIENNFQYQQYVPCMDGLQGRRGGKSYSISPIQYGQFLIRLFELWYRELKRGEYYSIRYFDNIVRMAWGGAPEQCSLVGRCGVQYVIEADGSVFPCDFYALDNYLMGNIVEYDFAQLDHMREQKEFIKQSVSIPEKCRDCQWLPLCRNGCRRDRWDVGSKKGLNYYCEGYRMFFEYAYPQIREIGKWFR